MKTYMKVSGIIIVILISLILLKFVHIIVGISFFVIGMGLLVYYGFIKKNNYTNKDIFNYKSTKIEIPKYLIPTKESDTEELVIAMCNEDVSWVNKYVDKYKLITIYNKCGKVVKFNSSNINVIECPNIGACDYAYLSYIIDRYDNLPDFIEFTKGWKEPKRKYHNCLPCNNNSKLYNELMIYSGYDYNFTYPANKHKHYIWYKSDYKNMGEWIQDNNFLNKELYKRNTCNLIYGGQFGSTKEQIQKTPKIIWEKIRSQQKYSHEEIDHFIERTWRVLLCKPKYKLVIVAIFKNEAIAIREWLYHYIKQGVEHFYMIDNGSTDDFKSKINTYIDKITMYTDSKKNYQEGHYNNYFLEEVKRNSEWVIVVDLDEFMYARKGYNNIMSYLDNLDKNIGQVRVSWKNFGSNGFIKQPTSIIKGFTKRRKIEDNTPMMYKNICKSIYLNEFGVHKHNTFGKIFKVTKKDDIINKKSEKTLEESHLVINHYLIQSWDWYKKIKMTRGDVGTVIVNNKYSKDYFDKEDINDIEDNELAHIYYKNYF